MPLKPSYGLNACGETTRIAGKTAIPTDDQSRARIYLKVSRLEEALGSQVSRVLEEASI